jgi:predicted DNA-binding transcriptional regulator YafY
MRRMREHDKLAKRLGMILTRLNTGEHLHLEDLVIEFNVSERTLQRDFNERLDYLPIEREGATYFLDPKVLGRQSAKNISILVINMGLDNLFPTKHFLSSGILNSETTPPFLFKNLRLENLSKSVMTFEKLTESVQNRNKISFTYQGENYDEVHPYRLINDRGIWYLAGTHRNRLYSFRVAKVLELVRYENKYQPDAFVSESIIKQGMNWIDAVAVEVVIQIDNRVASLFIDETVLPNQNILKELGDGTLLVSSQTNNMDELLPILRAWIPNIEILSPDWLRHELLRELQSYIDQANLF